MLLLHFDVPIKINKYITYIFSRLQHETGRIMTHILSANSSLLAHSRSVHISAKSHVPSLPHTTVNLPVLTCHSASAKNMKVSFQSEPELRFSCQWGLIRLKCDCLVYLWIWFPCHGLEQLVEVWPVALRVPSWLVQWWQPFAVLCVIH